VIVKDEQILAALQEERLSRRKADSAFPVPAVKSCLEIAGLDIRQLDAVA